MNPTLNANGIKVTGPVTPEFERILTPEALGLVASLAREFDGRRPKRVLVKVIGE